MNSLRPRTERGVSIFLRSIFLCSVALLCGVLLVASSARTSPAEEKSSAAEIEARISHDLEYLASDELEGRGVDTKGINLAAEYIAAEFAKMGLETRLFDGKPYQQFRINTSTDMGPAEQNHLELVHVASDGKSAATKLNLGKDFNPLALGGSDKFDAPLVFVGYGITSKDPAYDDYEGVDVKGKVVVVLRKEPQQRNPHSKFNGTQASRHAFFTTKVSNAFAHGAAAVMFVNDSLELTNQEKAAKAAFDKGLEDLEKAIAVLRELKDPMPEQIAQHREAIAKHAELVQELAAKLNEHDFDQLPPFNGAGSSDSRRSMPVFFASREAIEPMIKQALGKDLASIEAQIDETLQPLSAALTDWKATGEANVIHNQADVKNVMAVLEGEGPLADETVIVGAHYDHLGYGGPGSLAPWTKEIHNGADDNGSGTAALLEVARELAASGKKPARRIVFIAFTGEERGLLGSARYVREPRFPLEKTVAMVNMDMVGRLTDDKLVVYGTGTAAGFDKLIDDLNVKHGFKIRKDPSGFGPSDHSSFYGKKIPVFHVFTGTHKDYHRPSDDFDKINVPGMRRVVGLVTDIVQAIVDEPERPEYREVKQRAQINPMGDRPYLGSIPDFSVEVEGYALMGVAEDGPADRAGMKAGDVIVKFGDSKIGGLEDIDAALRKYKAGDKVPVVVKRDGKEVKLTVTLDPPR